MSDKPFLMKGHTFKKHGHKMTYPCIVEAKVDEVRLHVQLNHTDGFGASFTTVGFTSYAEKPLYNLTSFADRLMGLMGGHGVQHLDLGVWVNRNFNDTIRYTRSHNIPEELQEAVVEFIVFDAPEFGSQFTRRVLALDQIKAAGKVNGLKLLRPPRQYAESAEDVHRIYAEYREQGYEGAMVKSLDHTYECGKRIYGWLKYKPEEDADGVIVALHEAIAGKDQPELGIAKGDRLGRVGSVSVRVVSTEEGEVGEHAQSNASHPILCCAAGTTTDEAEATATPHGIPHDLGRHMLLHPDEYIGQWCEFKYMERDRQGGYRHPTFHRIREAKA